MLILTLLSFNIDTVDFPGRVLFIHLDQVTRSLQLVKLHFVHDCTVAVSLEDDGSTGSPSMYGPRKTCSNIQL